MRTTSVSLLDAQTSARHAALPPVGGLASAVASDERGAALPVAMLALAIASTVVVGVTVMAATEPAIANNHLRVAQARALAEAGVERALWALNNPGDARGIPLRFTAAPAPYDGSQLVMVPAGAHVPGGFRVTVTNGTADYERHITAVGWAPGDDPAGPKAVQKITATALNPRLIMKDPPAALAVRGPLHLGGTATVDARGDQTCGRKAATVSQGATSVDGSGVELRGATDDPGVTNQVVDAGSGPIPTTLGDAVAHVASSAFDGFLLTDADLDALRVLARARGTYLRGRVTFDSTHRMPNGLIFVDTVSGRNPRPGSDDPAALAADLASVEIDADAPADASGRWSGWLIVNGSVAVRGGVQMIGYVHAQGAVSYRGPGTGAVAGAIVSRSIGEATASVDGGATGALALVYDCGKARSGGDTIPGRWALKTGTYREVSGS